MKVFPKSVNSWRSYHRKFDTTFFLRHSVIYVSCSKQWELIRSLILIWNMYFSEMYELTRVLNISVRTSGKLITDVLPNNDNMRFWAPYWSLLPLKLRPCSYAGLQVSAYSSYDLGHWGSHRQRDSFWPVTAYAISSASLAKKDIILLENKNL